MPNACEQVRVKVEKDNWYEYIYIYQSHLRQVKIIKLLWATMDPASITLGGR
jgi:hypothetical protein